VSAFSTELCQKFIDPSLCRLRIKIFEISPSEHDAGFVVLATLRIARWASFQSCRLWLHPSCVYIGSPGTGILWDFTLGHYTVLDHQGDTHQMVVWMKPPYVFRKADFGRVDRFYWRLCCRILSSLDDPMECPIRREVPLLRTSGCYQHLRSGYEVTSSTYARPHC
jgi:hypothetical protein